MSLDVVDFHQSILLNASIEQLWPLISDTSRVNRLIGLPPSKQVEPGENLAQIIHSRYLNVPVSWHESPFQWVFEQWHEVERVFAAPIPVERVLTSTSLTAEGNATRVDLRVRLVNHNVFGWAASQLVIGRKMIRDVLGVYRLFEATAIAASNVPPPSPRHPQYNAERLEIGLVRLRRLGLDEHLIERLGTHLRRADDADVLKMRPFELAELWGADRQEMLKLCLYATRSGLLNLEWDVICPNCRGTNARNGALADLHHEGQCLACNIRYDLNFDESVELRFSVSPDVREAIDVSFCIGGPANTRHILAQLRIPARGTREITLRLKPGSYRIRTRQSEGEAHIDVAEDDLPDQATITVSQQTISLDQSTLAAGQSTLRISNTTNHEAILVFEERSWSRLAASAALVTALDEFRQLFSSEVLTPGVGLSVRNLTFLFSDLKDSTTIYDSIGDAPAYARVRDHFAVMRAIIAGHNGALVKTIGDAVMAVFPSAEDAAEAALEIQREFTAGEITNGRPALRVKLGLHCGPCIAVNANDLLDYFGSTVNIAARIQNESYGGDIVFSAAVAEDPGVVRLLAREQPVEQFERTLKGVSQRFTLFRLGMLPVQQVS